MSDRLLVGTRKGLFTVDKQSTRWTLREPAFLVDPVTAVLARLGGNTIHAALNLGHCGVKMRRSRDAGKTWEEQAAPAYPPQPENAPGPAWKLVQVWVLEAGGARNVRPWTVVDRMPGMGIHEVGVARMGVSAKTSVLNQFQQTHDIKNLFVMDGAGFTSSACQNPTLTIMALAVRSCDFLLNEMKRGVL